MWNLPIPACRCLRIALLVMLVAVLGDAKSQSPDLSDSQPSQFRKALAEASSPFEKTRADALARLAAERSWEPYLRLALNTRQTRLRQLRSALIQCQDGLFNGIWRGQAWEKNCWLPGGLRYTDDSVP